jgi:hypothetical protein
VVSDLRFENEAAFIRQRGGVVIHISRESATEVNPHVSEAGIGTITTRDQWAVVDGDKMHMITADEVLAAQTFPVSTRSSNKPAYLKPSRRPL